MPSNRPTRRPRPLWRLLTLVALACGAATSGPARAQPAGDAVVWGQDVFVIPYKWSGGSDRSAVREVILYFSDNQGRDWKEVTRARPDVQSFMYRAPGDGEYWFAIRTADAAGARWPSGPMRPELRVVVDTQLPTLRITLATLTPDGRLSVAAEASDPQLDASTAVVAYQDPTTGGWQTIQPTATPGVAGAATIQATAVLPAGSRGVMVRVSVQDRAGNPASAGVMAAAPYEASRGVPALSASATLGMGGSYAQPAPSSNHFAAIAQPSTGLPADPFTSSTAFVPQAPPTETPSLAAPNSAAASGWQPAAPQPAQVWRPDNTPIPSVAASQPGAPPTTAAPGPFRYASSAPPQDLPVQGGAAAPQRLLVNSERFELQYDLHSVGRWGVSRVEVWGTEDRGANWRRFAIDTDQRSPVDVQVQADGVYGFSILVQSVGGLDRDPPHSGDQPDIYVEVDRARPTVSIGDAVQPDGYFADHLNVTWQAGDANLVDRPISLLYAAQPSGPWMPIASNLPNNGRYSWRLQRHLPSRLYVRLEARDQAGNVGVDQTQQPVEIRLPESSGAIRHARPLQ
ncbi:hypothetical protein KOR34_46670 [Posidoniimonas corsicana]|uniref:Ser-Thr-rich glycosyl-phosphatidyl-inositol-anchored membrane family protein n=1 Tax=Posidoniimonas corsicana TaxID=1938618 RepID=A0A5C5UYI2_9BACT|nr:hypothetical protein [Posidoniimonas corsicana]TWT31291.1 hypothetical protein KOR34_46670 [Posidoniimonas corsicana]